MAYKELLKSMKGPDQFQIFFAKITKWFLRYKALWTVILVLIACATVVAVGSHLYLAKQGQTRLIELGALEARFSGDEASESKEFAESLKEYFLKHSSHPEGWVAGLKAVAIFTEHKELAPAREILEGILAKSRKFNFHQIHGSLLLINVLEELGEVDAALKRVDDFLKIAPQDLRPRIMLTKGRMLLSQGKAEEADVVLNSVINDFGNTTEASKARLLKSIGDKL
jgi:predicted negative regulator of RcsB-dependent stress response